MLVTIKLDCPGCGRKIELHERTTSTGTDEGFQRESVCEFCNEEIVVGFELRKGEQ